MTRKQEEHQYKRATTTQHNLHAKHEEASAIETMKAFDVGLSTKERLTDGILRRRPAMRIPSLLNIVLGILFLEVQSFWTSPVVGGIFLFQRNPTLTFWSDEFG